MSRLWNSQNSTKKSASKNPLKQRWWNLEGWRVCSSSSSSVPDFGLVWFSSWTVPGVYFVATLDRSLVQATPPGLGAQNRVPGCQATSAKRPPWRPPHQQNSIVTSRCRCSDAATPTSSRSHCCRHYHTRAGGQGRFGDDIGFKGCLWKRISCFLRFPWERSTTKHSILVLPSLVWPNKKSYKFQAISRHHFLPDEAGTNQKPFFLINWSRNSCKRIRSSPNIAEDHDSKSQWRTQ